MTQDEAFEILRKLIPPEQCYADIGGKSVSVFKPVYGIKIKNKNIYVEITLHADLVDQLCGIGEKEFENLSREEMVEICCELIKKSEEFK